MELTIFWTEFAEQKLDDIFYYYKMRTGLNTARKIVTEIVDKTITLVENPRLGPK